MPSNLRPRMRDMAEERKIEFEALPRGDTGEGSVEAIPFQVLSWNPRALYFPNFATAEQCQSIIKWQSSGMFISASEDKTGILDQIESKIAKATMLPKTHGEAFNVLRYEIGQRYHSHYDAFNPAEYGPQKSQRVASFLLYLSDVEEGGETMFPFENGQNMDANYDFRKCVGLKVRPHRGDGLLFYSLFPNGTIDPL
ncbi:UNVERIFIED_CONTAM: putative prolyl 4-hydroxylase 9 [Sesamum radiatum]|uniref:Prolyl 4-hydroxylase 9 n=1 Tax=Sesamum radiatum TaxID=300843 RepID=A0AAW2RC60_SESRA